MELLLDVLAGGTGGVFAGLPAGDFGLGDAVHGAERGICALEDEGASFGQAEDGEAFGGVLDVGAEAGFAGGQVLGAQADAILEFVVEGLLGFERDAAL